MIKEIKDAIIIEMRGSSLFSNDVLAQALLYLIQGASRMPEFKQNNHVDGLCYLAIQIIDSRELSTSDKTVIKLDYHGIEKLLDYSEAILELLRLVSEDFQDYYPGLVIKPLTGLLQALMCNPEKQAA